MAAVKILINWNFYIKIETVPHILYFSSSRLNNIRDEPLVKILYNNVERLETTSTLFLSSLCLLTTEAGKTK